MPAIDVNASKMVLSTDYPGDKIVYVKTGSLVIPASSTVTDSFAHELLFAPLLDGTWSTAIDFISATSYDLGTGPISTVAFQPFNTWLEASANATTVTVTGENPSGSSVTAYYRIYGLEPSNVNLDAPFTNNLVDSFTLNSDYNYTKLLDKDRVTTDTSITNELGHRVQVMAWEEIGGTITKKNVNYPNFGDTYISVSTTEVSITFDPFATPGIAVHYRVYLDE